MNGVAARNVLIVEDEWLVRMELVAAFEDEGYVVLESASAEDALAIIQARRRDHAPLDLLITDVRLSGTLTGWDLATQARALDAALAVIYVSANPLSPDRAVANSVFIDKPTLVHHVIAAADRLLA